MDDAKASLNVHSVTRNVSLRRFKGLSDKYQLVEKAALPDNNSLLDGIEWGRRYETLSLRGLGDGSQRL